MLTLVFCSRNGLPQLRQLSLRGRLLSLLNCSLALTSGRLKVG